MKKRLLGLWLALLPALALAQAAGPALRATKPLPRPRLVVGIVVDQMRFDFLYRYWDKYAKTGGFKRLLGEGFQYTNCHYDYVPTYTGPGHASVYTGATPSANGIVGNNWFEREAGKSTYVTDDPSVETVGSTSAAGKMSPRYLLTTTITDELRLATVESRVVGVCLKDRGSILPAGHFPTGAYWYDGLTGNFITSTFYEPELPKWVQEFNGRHRSDTLLKRPWEPLLPLAAYTESTSDDVAWENTFPGEERPVFPHNLAAIRAAGLAKVPMASQPPASYDLIRQTPFGNSITAEFAAAAIYGESLGRGPATDFLALSFSSTDYVGHFYGPNAIETEDTYLRLDRDLGLLLDLLENALGKDDVLVFLTADHGAAHATGFLEQRHVPAGSIGPYLMRDSLQHEMVRRHGAGNWVLAYDNQQIYLNHALIQKCGMKLADVEQEVVSFVTQFAGVSRGIAATDLQKSHWESGLLMYLENGFYPKRSGDVLIVLEPGWLEGYAGPLKKGTTHGSTSNYDTHVPLIFWGGPVKRGESAAAARVVDIAPTLAQFLRIQEPNGCTGRPLREVIRR
jgi:predicted AlkP superfamily pyrophosphatase or phosphodiesterase